MSVKDDAQGGGGWLTQSEFSVIRVIASRTKANDIGSTFPTVIISVVRCLLTDPLKITVLVDERGGGTTPLFSSGLYRRDGE
jgi:hypothetical protein